MKKSIENPVAKMCKSTAIVIFCFVLVGGWTLGSAFKIR